jgi:hypothetical protein
MANRFWVGGTGTWDATAGTKWATTSGGAGGASVPTIADDVFFDAASGTVTVTLGSGTITALSLNCTGFTGTFSGPSNANIVQVAGSITFSTTMTQGAANTFRVTGTGTINSAGKSFNTLEISGSGITVTLGSALSISASLNIIQGTLTTSASNYTMSIGSGGLNISGSLTKALQLNGSTVTFTSFGSFNDTSTGTTFNAGTSTLTHTSTSASINFAGNSRTFYNVSFSSAEISITGVNTFNTLTINAPTSAGVVPVNFSGNQTATTLVASGASEIRRVRFFSSSYAKRTLTVGTYTTKSQIDFQNIIAAGASSPWSGTGLGDLGGNTSITFPSAKTVYWNLSGTQSWTATGWATSAGGAPAAANFPLAQDTAVFTNTGAAGTVTLGTRFSVGTLDLSARTNAMTLNPPVSVVFYITKNLLLGSGVTTGAGSLGTTSIELSAASAQTITSNGVTLNFGVGIAPIGSGSLTLTDAYASTGFLVARGYSTTGTVFDASSFNVSANSFQTDSNPTVALGSGTWTLTGTGTVWSVGAGATINAGSSAIVLSNNTTTARTFSGGGKSYGKLTIGGATSTSTTTVQGSNTFTELASTKTVAHTITFTSGTTQTLGAFTVTGSLGNVVTINSSSTGSAATLSKSSGIVSSDYLSIRDSTATGGATWYAGANSTNVSNNTGWLFANVPSSGMMMSFFPV